MQSCWCVDYKLRPLFYDLGEKIANLLGKAVNREYTELINVNDFEANQSDNVNESCDDSS